MASVPTCNVWGFQFLYNLLNTYCFFFLFDYSHPSEYESVISLWFLFCKEILMLLSVKSYSADAEMDTEI